MNLPTISFQTFFISRDTSNNPQIPDIINFCKKISKLETLKNCKGSISVSYGKRILINGIDVAFDDIKQGDILEIVDFDPIKNIVLAIGKKHPSNTLPVHWIIQQARNDVNAVIMFNSTELSEKFLKKLPTTENEKPLGSIDQVKEILKTLRKSNNIMVKNQGVLSVGFNLKEVEDSILQLFRKG